MKKPSSPAEKWLLSPFDANTHFQVRQLMEHNRPELEEAFAKDLDFGTGGMRGIMGVGTNRINVYTIRAATQGLAQYIKKQNIEKPSVFIGYDVRHHSKEFALESAKVLAANNILVYLTSEICPTPLVSFGCRYYNCTAAIMITASHNPPEYNGYKVYWSDGGQVVPPHDEGIIKEVRKVDLYQEIKTSPENSPFIRPVGRELDEHYLKELKALQLYPSSPLKILYSPLHGTGIRALPDALRSWGYSDIRFVEEQKYPDPKFTHAKSPNPESPSALELGTKQLLKEKEDIFIATDPDADRIGVVTAEGALTGNQMACIALYHLCTKPLPTNPLFVKTIVTTELFRKIAESFGGTCLDVLTGFKYIAEIMTKEPNRFVFGAEESYGSLHGTIVRDKDAINAACLIVEAAALAKKEGTTLFGRLREIYTKYGIHREALHSLSFPGVKGMEQMNELMARLRQNPPASLSIASTLDYSQGLNGLPPSDVLQFILTDKSKLTIRPSGTEPKIKIYAEVVQETITNLDKDIADCDNRLNQLIKVNFN